MRRTDPPSFPVFADAISGAVWDRSGGAVAWRQSRDCKCKTNAKKRLARAAPAVPDPSPIMSMSGSESDDEVENGLQPYDDAVEEESDDDARLDESGSASGSEAEDRNEEDEPNEASQIVNAMTNAAPSKQKQPHPPPAPAPSPVATEDKETRRVCFRSLKGGPNKTTEVIIPQERIVHGQNAIAQPATDSDMEDWLNWKKAMHCFTEDFETGVLSSKSIMAVRFQESERDSFVVLGFVAETKGKFYFVPVSNSTAEALMEDPTRFLQSAQAARAVQNNQAVYDRAKKKPFPDRTKLAKKMLDAIKTEESVWQAVPQPKAPRKASAPRSKAAKDDSGAGAAEAAAAKDTSAVRAKEASASPKAGAALSDEDEAEVSAFKKAKAGGSRRVQPSGSEEPKGKAMKQSTLLQPPKAKEDRSAAGAPQPQAQQALEDDAALLPEPSEAPKPSLADGLRSSQSGAKRTKTDSASSDATCMPEQQQQQHRSSHRKRSKVAPTAQDQTFWNVDLPMLPPSDAKQTSVLYRAEWEQGQTGALQVVVTQHFSMSIPRGCELAKAGVFVKTYAEEETEPLKIALRPTQA